MSTKGSVETPASRTTEKSQVLKIKSFTSTETVLTLETKGLGTFTDTISSLKFEEQTYDLKESISFDITLSQRNFLLGQQFFKLHYTTEIISEETNKIDLETSLVNSKTTVKYKYVPSEWKNAEFWDVCYWCDQKNVLILDDAPWQIADCDFVFANKYNDNNEPINTTKTVKYSTLGDLHIRANAEIAVLAFIPKEIECTSNSYRNLNSTTNTYHVLAAMPTEETISFPSPKVNTQKMLINSFSTNGVTQTNAQTTLYNTTITMGEYKIKQNYADEWIDLLFNETYIVDHYTGNDPRIVRIQQNINPKIPSMFNQMIGNVDNFCSQKIGEYDHSEFVEMIRASPDYKKFWGKSSIFPENFLSVNPTNGASLYNPLTADFSMITILEPTTTIDIQIPPLQLKEPLCNIKSQSYVNGTTAFNSSSADRNIQWTIIIENQGTIDASLELNFFDSNYTTSMPFDMEYPSIVNVSASTETTILINLGSLTNYTGDLTMIFSLKLKKKPLWTTFNEQIQQIFHLENGYTVSFCDAQINQIPDYNVSYNSTIMDNNSSKIDVLFNVSLTHAYHEIQANMTCNITVPHRIDSQLLYGTISNYMLNVTFLDSPEQIPIHCNVTFIPHPNDCYNASTFVKQLNFSMRTPPCHNPSEIYIIPHSITDLNNSILDQNPFLLQWQNIDSICDDDYCYQKHVFDYKIQNYGNMSGNVQHTLICDGITISTEISTICDDCQQSYQKNSTLKSLTTHQCQLHVFVNRTMCQSIKGKEYTTYFEIIPQCPSNVSITNFIESNIDGLINTVTLNEKDLYWFWKIPIFKSGTNIQREMTMNTTFVVESQKQTVIETMTIYDSSPQYVSKIVPFNQLIEHAHKEMCVHLDLSLNVSPCQTGLQQYTLKKCIKLNSTEMTEHFGNKLYRTHTPEVSYQFNQTISELTVIHNESKVCYCVYPNQCNSIEATCSFSNFTIQTSCLQDFPACNLNFNSTVYDLYGFAYILNKTLELRNSSYIPIVPDPTQTYADRIIIPKLEIEDINEAFTFICHDTTNSMFTLPLTLEISKNLSCVLNFNSEKVTELLLNYTILPSPSLANIEPSGTVNDTLLIQYGEFFISLNNSENYFKVLNVFELKNTNDFIITNIVTYKFNDSKHYPTIVSRTYIMLPKCKQPELLIETYDYWSIIKGNCEYTDQILMYLDNNLILGNSKILNEGNITAICQYKENICSTSSTKEIHTSEPISLIPFEYSFCDVKNVTFNETFCLTIKSDIADASNFNVKLKIGDDIFINNNCYNPLELGKLKVTPIIYYQEQIKEMEELTITVQSPPPNITIYPPCGSTLSSSQKIKILSTLPHEITIKNDTFSQNINPSEDIQILESVTYEIFTNHIYYYYNKSQICQYSALNIANEVLIPITLILILISVSFCLIFVVFPNLCNFLIKNKQNEHFNKFIDSDMQTALFRNRSDSSDLEIF
eukprot:TRINITY_DN1665_c0_g1_i1.p1 TRINITY_DN1665_c0_g1~~TRINITY_DN1665_c0_g1_i1.p1  ORF type:complete len:1454 (+),score=266.46 TRINITY_DN1665_c0_g1_i1:423-4784(+)